MNVTKYKIGMGQEQLMILLNECFFKSRNETGGIMMGCQIENDFYITDIVGPGEGAIHTANSFTPDNDFHEAEMARIYSESGRIHTYLGDWHTHPGNKAYLSERDKRTMRNISGNAPSRLLEPLMLIIGTDPFEIKVWIYKPGSAFVFQHVRLRLMH